MFVVSNVINLHNHVEKAILATYAQMLSGLVEDEELSLAYCPSQNKLFIKTKADTSKQIYPLGLQLFSFNEDSAKPSSESAHATFKSVFPDINAMNKRMQKRANFRDEALYARDEGTPAVSQDQLDISLK